MCRMHLQAQTDGQTDGHRHWTFRTPRSDNTADLRVGSARDDGTL